jgi:hypothetical protein
MDAGPPPGLPLGSDCNQNSDCQSMLCKPVVIDNNPVCVTPCTQQSDCGAGTNYFCEPITSGSTNGYCIPHSPAHCLSCTQDSDCGSLSEVCFQAMGDIAKACHVDCSIAGQAACPPDYSCVTEVANGFNRQVCRPKMIPDCLDAVGGYCDRLSIPQPCSRINSAGTCLGERACLQPSKRFDKCSAAAPQCKTDCSVQDPAGCMETYCASATNTVTNCGMCNYVCPGYQKPNDNVTCDVTEKCTFSCQGENYDVNNNPSDGCEVPDAPQGNHVQSSAADHGQVSDCDSSNDMEFMFGGQMPSDKRVHETPAVVGFDTNSGSAPDWYQIFGVGHLTCYNDIVMQLCVQGSSNPSCYRLDAVPASGTPHGCQVDASGCCPPDPNPQGSCATSQVPFMGICQNQGGQFADNTEIYIKVSKTCDMFTLTENVTYQVYGHL